MSETDSGENQFKIFNGTDYIDASGALVTGFENVDASGASGGVTIFGSSSVKLSTSGGLGNDTITGGNLNDTIKGGLGNDNLSGGQGNDVLLGGAGVDILSGGVGADTLTGGDGLDQFVFQKDDLTSDATSSDSITDLRIGEAIILDKNTLNIEKWSGINKTDETARPNEITSGEDSVLSANLREAYIQKINNNYLLVVEKEADGSELGYIKLGSIKIGEPNKWDFSSSEGSITVVTNEAPSIAITETTSDVRETSFLGSGFITTFGKEGTNERYISVDDTDKDSLYVTVSSTGGTLSVDGINYTSSIEIGDADNKKTIEEINTLLENLSFKGTTRGNGEITVSANDGFVSNSTTSQLFFTIPNTPPSLTVPSSGLTGKIGGDPVSLSGIVLTDPDTADNDTNALMSLTLNASSGQFTADLTNFTTETGITYDHDGDNGDGSNGTTLPLPVMSISDDGQKVYIAAQQLSTGTKGFC